MRFFFKNSRISKEKCVVQELLRFFKFKLVYLIPWEFMKVPIKFYQISLKINQNMAF